MAGSEDDRRGGMRRPSGLAAALRADPGLCGSCLHARRVDTSRGGAFWLCGRAADEPRFPRYPQLPVVACAGYSTTSGR